MAAWPGTAAAPCLPINAAPKPTRSPYHQHLSPLAGHPAPGRRHAAAGLPAHKGGFRVAVCAVMRTCMGGCLRCGCPALVAALCCLAVVAQPWLVFVLRCPCVTPHGTIQLAPTPQPCVAGPDRGLPLRPQPRRAQGLCRRGSAALPTRPDRPRQPLCDGCAG